MENYIFNSLSFVLSIVLHLKTIAKQRQVIGCFGDAPVPTCWIEMDLEMVGFRKRVSFDGRGLVKIRNNYQKW